eukprot:Tbor_TRINITY_DN6045_c3_g1::TRINITY_DN6045_c3_g1_i1::g.11449::m.11449
MKRTFFWRGVNDPVFIRNIKKSFEKYRDVIGTTKKKSMSREGYIDIDDKGLSWYVGHMNLAMNVLKEKVDKVDFILEMRDARLPFTTENPKLRKLSRGKPKLIVFNKAELANEDCNLAVQKYYEQQGDFAMFTSTRRTWKDVVEAIQKFALHVLPPLEHSTTAHIGLVVGMPNVGKSTLINALRLSHEYQFRREDFRKTRSPEQMSSMAGSTRHVKLVHVSRNPNIVLYDTPGLTLPGHFSPEAGLKLAACGIVPTNDLSLPTMLVARYIYDLMAFSGATEHMAECLHLPRAPVSFDDCASLIADRSGNSSKTLVGINLIEFAHSFILEDFKSGHLGRVTLDRLPRRVKAQLSTPDEPLTQIGEAPSDSSSSQSSCEEDASDSREHFTYNVHSTDVVSRYPENLREIMEEIEGRPQRDYSKRKDTKSKSKFTSSTDDIGVISRQKGPISRVSISSLNDRNNMRVKPGR